MDVVLVEYRWMMTNKITWPRHYSIAELLEYFRIKDYVIELKKDK